MSKTEAKPVIPQDGDAAPDFDLPIQGGGRVRLSAYRGHRVILFFYPKDDSPGCTREACEFRDKMTDYKGMDVTVIGVSKDSVESHEKFVKKYGLNFIVASDKDNDTAERYGVWIEKKMFGQKYMGMQRSTFLIDEAGLILRQWRNIKPDGHASAVLSSIASTAA